MSIKKEQNLNDKEDMNQLQKEENKNEGLIGEKIKKSRYSQQILPDDFQLTEAEKLEKEFYGVTVQNLVNDFCDRVENLNKDIQSQVTGMLEENKKNELLEKNFDDKKYIDISKKNFEAKLDGAERELKEVLELNNIPRDILFYFKEKEMNQNYYLMEYEKMKEQLKKEKEEIYELSHLRSKLKMEIEVEKQINNRKKERIDDIKAIKNISDSFYNKIDYNTIQNNLKYMKEKLDKIGNKYDSLKKHKEE